MPDQIPEFLHLRNAPVPPAPTAEDVRRRGDAMRRRRQLGTAVGAVAAVGAVFAATLWVGSPNADRGLQPAPSPSPSQLRLEPGQLLTPADLPPTALDPGITDMGLEPWAVRKDAPVLDCAPRKDAAAALGATDSVQTSMGFRVDFQGAPADRPDFAQLREQVLQFPDAATALAAAEQAAGWVQDCAKPYVGGPAQPVKEARFDHGTPVEFGASGRWMFPAPEQCSGDCDAVWVTQQVVLQHGSQVVLWSLETGAGPKEPFGFQHEVSAIAPLMAAKAWGGGLPTQPDPSVLQTAAVDAIPDDFALAEGWPDGKLTGPGRDGVWPLDQQVSPCYLDITLPEPLDRLRASLKTDDGSRNREIILFSKSLTAQIWMEELADSARACKPKGDRGLRVETVDLPGGVPSLSIWWTTEDGRGQDLVQVTQRGPALLIERRTVPQRRAVAPYDDDFEATSQPQYADAAPVVDAMCLFTGDCPESETTASETGPALYLPDAPDSERIGQGDVPDLNLARGLPNMTGDGGEFHQPASDVEGIDRLQICGTPVLDQSLSLTGRLAASSSGPEYWEFREALAFGDAEAAVTQMENVRRLLADCPRQPNEGGGNELKWETIDDDHGYDEVTFGFSYVEPGSDQLAGTGGLVVQITRVGRALMIVGTSGEFSGSESLRDASKTMWRTSESHLNGFCSFTAAGCGS